MSTSKLQPLVSVGIPTYNNPEGLRRTLECISGQTYKNLEIIVSDNCSLDPDVEKVTDEFIIKDRRVKHYRQTENKGASFNFQFVLEKATGVYFMWAADDDAGDGNYIKTCVEFLERSPDYVLASGRMKYLRPDGSFFDGDEVSIESAEPTERVLRYFESVGENGVFYGIYRTIVVKRVPIHNVIGGDWIAIGELCYLGKVKVLPETTLYRDASYMKVQDPMKRLCKMVGLPNIAAKVPYFWAAQSIRNCLLHSTVIDIPAHREHLSNAVYQILKRRLMSGYRGIRNLLRIFYSRLYIACNKQYKQYL